MSTQISTKTIVQDEGTIVLSNDIINFTGSGVTVTNVGGAAQVYIPSPPTGLTYKGLWDATLNSPTLTSSVGTSGDFYIVSVAGTTNLNGVTDWQVSDWAIFEGGVWQKIDNHDIQAYNTVKDESTILPQRSVLKFEGTGVTASDAGGETVVTIPTPQTYTTVQDEGTPLTQRTTINFTGEVTASDVGGLTQVNVPLQQAYNTIQEEGAALTQQPIIDFQGTGVTATNGIGKTIITIPGNVPSTSYGLYAQTVTGPSVTGIAEQSIIGAGVGTLSVPANAFSIGDSFTAALDGIISCVGTATIHIHVKTVTGVIIADTGVVSLDTATNKAWLLSLYFTIRTLGGAGVASISSGGLFSYIKNSGTNFEGYVLSTINTTTFNTTVNNELVITAQFNTGNAGNTIKSYNFTLQKVY